MTDAKSYKDTVNLPQTEFSMRANAVKREPELQQFWQDQQIYQRLSQTNPGDSFILHDGPPYANGALHMGHALNKILKDIINKYKLLQGHKVRYIPGWDCHGLPIELKVLQAMDSEERQALTPIKLRRKARKFALKTVDQQRQGFQRYGVWGDWDNPYLTLTPEYEAAQIGVFGQMVLKGYIYRGMKPVHWSPSSQTALAEAELEYPEGHTSRSLYAAFPLTKASDSVEAKLKPYLVDLGVAIWTTTPWTIPGNLAVAVNPELTYAVVEVSGKSASQEAEKSSKPSKTKAKGFAPTPDEDSPESDSTDSDTEAEGFKYLIVAAELVERLSQTLDKDLTVKTTLKGQELDQCTYRHPLFDRESPIVIGGDYITTESGTGLVHTAPGHGQEDYIVGQRYNLPIISPVDGNGDFTTEAGPFAGLNVLRNANPAVIDALKEAGSFLKEENYVHKYPYDWRTKEPTIFRATEQWFASVDGFREEVMKAIQSVDWIPSQGENRITAMVSERSDWCISRQRSWGVPIPVFYDEETNEPLLTEETIAHVQGIIAEKGSDAWWELPVTELLPESYRNNGRTYRKGTDTMDVWFDSGSSWAGVVQEREELSYPVDMYLEGSDQHRGWFQSSILTSVATNGCAPYKSVLTHGFVLDEQGRKMSKSVGNVVDPATIIEGGKNHKQEPPYGADMLRLWVSSVDYSVDVPIGQGILKQLSDIYRKIRNTARFLLGNLHDFDPAKNAVAYEQLPELDRYMLHRMTEVFGEVTEAFDSYQFFRFFQTVQNFCVVDLSNFYLDVAKDRLYISHPDSVRRRSCQTVLAIALENLARSIAPVLCHTAEDIWQYLPYPTPDKSVFESGWVQLDETWKKPELVEKWTRLRAIRTEVNKVLEQARAEKMIGSSLEAKVLLHVPDTQLRQQLRKLNPSGIPRLWLHTPKPELMLKEPEAALASEIVSLQTEAKEWNVNQILYTVLTTLRQVFSENQRVWLTVGVIVAVPITLKVTATVLASIAHLPLLADMLQLVGVGYSAWFINRYLLRAPNRQELAEKARSLKTEVLGEGSPQPEPATTEPEAAPPPPAQPQPRILGERFTVLSNGVDELRYLFLASQVEVLDSPDALENTDYRSQSEHVWVGVVKAEGEKCDRCWNYSPFVGKIAEHPTICERCRAALAGQW